MRNTAPLPPSRRKHPDPQPARLKSNDLGCGKNGDGPGRPRGSRYSGEAGTGMRPDPDSAGKGEALETEYVLWGHTRKLVRDSLCDQSPVCPGIEGWLFYIAFGAGNDYISREGSDENG